MANPYLIQAIYGPKPRKPSAATSSNTVRDVPEPSDRPLSLIERLYGVSKPVEAQVGSDGLSTLEDDEKDTTPLPSIEAAAPPSFSSIRVKTKPYSPSSSSLGPLPSSSLAPMPTSSPIPVLFPKATLNSILKWPPERYLPPPGPFYDQFDLPSIFGLAFFHDKCNKCWGLRHICIKAGKCPKACRVCETKDHIDTTCPLLYCTLRWYGERRIPYGAPSGQPRQFRPSPTEFTVLLQMGFFLNVKQHGDPIIPNAAHPIVHAFYLDKTAPQQMNKSTVVARATQKPNVGRGMLKHEPQLSKPVMVPMDTPQNPKVKPPVVPTTPTQPLAMRPQADATRLYDAQIKTPAGTTSTRDGMEDRLQELEEEVLKLKTENIVKDREIRKLKSENEQLRGVGIEPGGKRRRA